MPNPVPCAVSVVEVAVDVEVEVEARVGFARVLVADDSCVGVVCCLLVPWNTHMHIYIYIYIYINIPVHPHSSHANTPSHPDHIYPPSNNAQHPKVVNLPSQHPSVSNPTKHIHIQPKKKTKKESKYHQPHTRPPAPVPH